MPAFEYKALNAKGHEETGILEADIGLVMLLGLGVSLFGLIIAIIFSKKIFAQKNTFL